MSALLAVLRVGVPGSTVNRLCGSGLDPLGTAARAIKSGEARRRTTWCWPRRSRPCRLEKGGVFDAEISPVTIAQKKNEDVVVARDEHPRETTLEALAKLKGVVRPYGTVTAGNASGVNDGDVEPSPLP